MTNDENPGSYFNAVVRDALAQLEKAGACVVFTQDQVDAIKEVHPDVEVRFSEGFYYLGKEIPDDYE